MKKKIVTLLIIGLITGVLFGCSTKQNSSSQTSESNTSENNNSENSGSESTPPSGDEKDNLDYDKQFEQFKQARPDYREFGHGYGVELIEGEVATKEWVYLFLPKEMVDDKYYGFDDRIPLYYYGPYENKMYEDGWESTKDDNRIEYGSMRQLYNCLDEDGLNNLSKIVEKVSEAVSGTDDYYFESNPINQSELLNTGKYVDANGLQFSFEQNVTAQGIKYVKYNVVADNCSASYDLYRNYIYYIFDNPYAEGYYFETKSKPAIDTFAQWSVKDSDLQSFYDRIDDCVINHTFFATDDSAFNEYANNDEAVLENLREAVKDYVEAYYYDKYEMDKLIISNWMLPDESDKHDVVDGDLLSWNEYYKEYVKFGDIDYNRDKHSAKVPCTCTLYDLKNERKRVDDMILDFVADENNLNWHIAESGEGVASGDNTTKEGAISDDNGSITTSNDNGTTEGGNNSNISNVYDLAIQNLSNGVAPDGKTAFDEFMGTTPEVEYSIYDFDGDGKDDILVHWLTDTTNANEYCMIYLNKGDSFSLENYISFDEAIRCYPTYWTIIN